MFPKVSYRTGAQKYKPLLHCRPTGSLKLESIEYICDEMADEHNY